MKYWYLLILLIAGICVSCQDDELIPTIRNSATVDLVIDKSQTFLDNDLESKLRDSVWYYYKQLSLWDYSILPNDISKMDEAGYLRSAYTQYFSTSEDVLSFLMANMPYNRGVGKSIDKYSFLDRYGSINNSLNGGTINSFGFEPFFLQNSLSADNAFLYIKLVDRGSPAFYAGLRRGDRIVKVNGASNIDYNAQYAQNFSFLNAAFSASYLMLIVERTDGQLESINISRGSSYIYDALISDKVITYGTKKVGYLAFSSFADVAATTKMYRDFERLFSSFEQSGIDELVVDLRNNGGGYVSTAEYLANKIAPVSANEKLMLTYGTNAYVKDLEYLAGEFDPVYFQKSNSLDLDRVYFLVSDETASASELLINTLRPYMDVVLVGTISTDSSGKQTNDRTYGKPVGFFKKDLFGTLGLYVTSFQMFNAAGVGRYYDGFSSHIHVREYLNFYDFGDERETMLSAALQDMDTGVRSASGSIRQSARAVKEFSLNKRSVDKDMFKMANPR